MHFSIRGWLTFSLHRNDYEALRQGNRVVSLGEKPYFDPNSTSRRKALQLEKEDDDPAKTM
jgi:hypothetical protein